MNKLTREEIAAVIRSGKYKQTTGYLRSKDGECFCFLGAVCDIVDPDGWSPPTERYPYWTHRGNVAIPAPKVLAAVDMGEGEANRLAEDNDDRELSLDDVAGEFVKRTYTFADADEE